MASWSVRAVVAVGAAVLLCSCTESEPPAKQAPSVAVSVDGVDDLLVGVVVSRRSAVGEGSELAGPSAGAHVAAYRLRLGRTPVRLRVIDDRGRADRAVRAVDDLVRAGAGGIVLATTGRHVGPALRAASRAGVPVVAPYLRGSGSSLPGVHVSGPTQDQVDAALERALGEDDRSRPTLVDAAPVPDPGLDVVDTLRYRRDDTVRRVADAVRQGRTDSVIVSAPAAIQGAVRSALADRLPDLPVYLTPEALSPELSRALRAGGASLSGRLVTVGTGAGDASVLATGDQADAAAAFFFALRLAAQDGGFARSLRGVSVTDAVEQADVASHDAVIALARAAGEAASSKPTDVESALSRLRLGPRQSIAGAPLDLTGSPVLADDAVVPLRATDQSAGARPADATPPLIWFVQPRQP